MKRLFVWCISASLLMLSSCNNIVKSARAIDAKVAKPSGPKNVILMIGDGMGFEYIKAARIYNGKRPLSFEHFPCKTRVTTCAIDGANKEGQCLKDSGHVTDSAAAATAMATGIKVKNGVISKLRSNGEQDVETILEASKCMGKSTGIVATKLFTDATPAAFVSHADGRNSMEEILHDMFRDSKPNVIFGADTDLHRRIAKSSSVQYQMVHSTEQMNALANAINLGPTCNGSNCPHIYGGFGQFQMIPGRVDPEAGLPYEIIPEGKFVELGMPHLSQMTSAALKILSKNDKGFFLMVESSNTDMIGHLNAHIDRHEQLPSAAAFLVREMMEVERTMKILEEFVKTNPDTLLLLTADHETGGLVVEEDKTDCLGRDHCLPVVRWTSAKYEPEKNDSFARHTGVDVPLYAIGAGSERFCQESINNTDIPKMALGR